MHQEQTTISNMSPTLKLGNGQLCQPLEATSYGKIVVIM